MNIETRSENNLELSKKKTVDTPITSYYPREQGQSFDFEQEDADAFLDHALNQKENNPEEIEKLLNDILITKDPLAIKEFELRCREKEIFSGLQKLKDLKCTINIEKVYSYDEDMNHYLASYNIPEPLKTIHKQELWIPKENHIEKGNSSYDNIIAEFLANIETAEFNIKMAIKEYNTSPKDFEKFNKERLNNLPSIQSIMNIVSQKPTAIRDKTSYNSFDAEDQQALNSLCRKPDGNLSPNIEKNIKKLYEQGGVLLHDYYRDQSCFVLTPDKKIIKIGRRRTDYVEMYKIFANTLEKIINQ